MSLRHAALIRLAHHARAVAARMPVTCASASALARAASSERALCDGAVSAPAGRRLSAIVNACASALDLQARRMTARCKAKGDKQTQFLHSLNGSGLAVGRTLIAVMENYQQADGSLAVPEPLQPYMGGIKVISA